MKKEIIIQSTTIDAKILKSCQALIAAFFPGSKVIIEAERAKLAGEECLSLNRDR
ncbi:MAG: hypothetical protein GX248_08140, partial [Peptococcaceae bacterium]|nr:hypothetical protein [Peptococcaceae bacterium]